MSINVRKLDDGSRRYDVRLRDSDGRVYNRTFRTRKDAEVFAARERADRSRGAWVDPRQATLSVEEVARRWLAVNPAKRPTTMATDELTVRKHIMPAIGRRRIGSLGPNDIQALVNAWAAAGQAPRTVRRSYGVLRALLAHAVLADWLARSPCRGIKLPPVTTTRRTFLHAADVVAIAGATPPPHQAMVWIGAVLGLRWSEVAGLRVKRLDLLNRTLAVAETVTRDSKGDPHLGPPKSSAGARTLAMPAALADILAAHLAARGLTAADRERLVFEAPEGGPVRYANWRTRSWLPATRAAGCPTAGFHDLRRAAATVLVTGGVDVRTAQARLGHSDPRITLAVYAQVVAEADRRAADTAGAAFLSTLATRSAP